MGKFPGGREIRLKQVNETWLMAWQRFLKEQALAVEAGVDQYVLSKLLGHTSIRHTAIYSQVPITVKKEAISKLPELDYK